MRSFVLALCILLATAAPALAAPAHDGASLASLDCCHQISASCTRLKTAPRCEATCHRCAPTFDICREVCLPEVCHREPAFCDIDRPVCIPEPCHREAVTLLAADDCPCEPRLTADRGLIIE